MISNREAHLVFWEACIQGTFDPIRSRDILAGRVHRWDLLKKTLDDTMHLTNWNSVSSLHVTIYIHQAWLFPFSAEYLHKLSCFRKLGAGIPNYQAHLCLQVMIPPFSSFVLKITGQKASETFVRKISNSSKYSAVPCHKPGSCSGFEILYRRYARTKAVQESLRSRLSKRVYGALYW